MALFHSVIFFFCAFSLLWQAFLSVLCPLHSIWLGNLVLGLLVIFCFFSHVLTCFCCGLRMRWFLWFLSTSQWDVTIPFHSERLATCSYWATVPVLQKLDWEPPVTSRFFATDLGHEECITKQHAPERCQGNWEPWYAGHGVEKFVWVEISSRAQHQQEKYLYSIACYRRAAQWIAPFAAIVVIWLVLVHLLFSVSILSINIHCRAKQIFFFFRKGNFIDRYGL